MKKETITLIVTVLFILCSAFVFVNCGGSGGGVDASGDDGSVSGSSSTVIDISHDGDGGYTFGKSSNEIKRFQTFIANSNQSLTKVEVKIRQIAAGTYHDISVGLHETDSGNQPSNLLAMTSINAGEIGTAFGAVSVPLTYYGLVAGKRYAIVLEQYAVTSVSNSGYEWCTKQVSADNYFGQYNGSAWIDESGMGDGWLKVYVDNSRGTNPVSGSLDTGFGAGGIVHTSIGIYADYANAVAIQSDGKIVVAGEYCHDLYLGNSGSSYESDFALVRYSNNGSLDAGFGTGGMVTTPIGQHAGASAVAIQPDGKIVAAGNSDNGFTLVRYNADGSLDSGFGTGGIAATPIGTFESAQGAAIQSDGKVVVAGYSNNGSGIDFALVRYNADGSLDSGFGTNGIVTTPIGASYDYALAVAIQLDGKIMAAGLADNANEDFALVRYNADGSLDTGFGTGGKLTTDIGTGHQDAADTVAIQSDGKIVAAGSSDNKYALVRYNADGSLDSSFGTGGKVTTSSGGYYDNIEAIAIQSDGKIVAVGSFTIDSRDRSHLMRYSSNGSLDAGFGTGGMVTGEPVSNITIQSDGKIVIVGFQFSGYRYEGPDYDFAVVRYWP